MPLHSLLRLCSGALSALALLLLTGPAWSQVVVPASHVLVLQPGGTGKLSVKTDCPSSFTVQTANPGVVGLPASDPKPGSSASVTISALGEAGSSGTLRLDITPDDSGCGDHQVVIVGVYVVDPAKALVHTFVKGDVKADPPLLGATGWLGQLRADLEQVLADHQAVSKDILQQLLAGDVSVPPLLPPGPEGEQGPPPPPGTGLAMTQSARALAALALAEGAALDRAEQAYWRAVKGMAFEAVSLLTLAGYFTDAPFSAPSAMQPGSGGEWDRQRARAAGLLQGIAPRLAAISAKARSGIAKLSAQRDEPLFSRARRIAVPDPGSGGASPLTGAQTDPTRNMGTSILSASAWNGPTNGGFVTANGRIQLLARLPVGGAFVLIQQVDFAGQNIGAAQGDTFPVDPANHQLTLFWPPLTEAPNLKPGTWRVVVSGPENHVAFAYVIVPAS